MSAIEQAPVLAPVEEPTLREFVRGKLKVRRDPDPTSVVNEVCATMTAAQTEEAARVGVRLLAHEIARGERREAFRELAPPQPSAKWAETARLSRDRPDIFAATVVVGYDEDHQPIHAFLGDCDRKMLAGAERLVRDQGDALHARADQYAALGRKLKGAAVVRSLPAKTVEAVLHA